MDNIRLLKIDIFQRLPYGLFVMNERISDEPIIYTEDYHPYVESCKPYLRPMSSMTLEERVEYDKYINGNISVENHINEIDWLTAHYLDYRGLIPMGLALEAPENMYKN